MILSDVFERFSRDSPLSVMAQGIMENALNPQILDQLFEDVAEKQFTKGAIASMPRISAEFERSGSESCPEFFSGGREALEKEAISL